MDQLQSKLYQLLVEIDDICRRNDVTYYLAGGTALGAIRGGGFLPWDDDIDLYITRENWNKLVEVMKTETPEDRLFVCVENTPYYYNPVGRYVDRNTTVMMKSQLLCAKACGQLLEFFIMDPMPMAEDEKWEHRKNVKAYAEILSPYFVTGKNILTENKDYDVELYNRYYRRSLRVGQEKVLKEILEKIASVDEKDSEYYCMRWGIRTLIYGKDLLGEPRMEKFEDAYFPIPAKQEEVARIAYGDSWMYVPEGSGKVVHGLNKDLTTPFQQYVDLYMPLLNKKKLLRKYRKNKRVRAKALYQKCMFKMEFAKARAQLAAKYIKENDYDTASMRRLLEEGNYDALEKHLAFFYSEQLHPEIKTNRVLLDLSDEYLYIAVMLFILEGYYYKASAILSMRKEKDAPLSEDLKKADEMMQFCRELSIAVYDKKDADLTLNILNGHEQYRDVSVDYARAELWIMYQKANVREDYAKIIAKAEKWMEKYPNDGEISRWLGKALYSTGDTESARHAYESAIKHTRNGFVWREAGELFGIDAYDIVDCQMDNEEEDVDIKEEGNDE